MQKQLKVKDVIRCGKALNSIYEKSKAMSFQNAYNIKKAIMECEIIEEYVSRRLEIEGVFEMGGMPLTEGANRLINEIETTTVVMELPEITEESLKSDEGLRMPDDEFDEIRLILALKTENDITTPPQCTEAEETNKTSQGTNETTPQVVEENIKAKKGKKAANHKRKA